MKHLFSITLTLFLVMDALGTIPAYLSVFDTLKEEKRRFVAYREILLSLVMLIVFFFAGSLIVKLLDVHYQTVEVSGGVVLFLIATRFVFLEESGAGSSWEPGAHIIVPIATPIIANPSMFAALMIFSTKGVSTVEILVALVIAWAISALIYFFAKPIKRVFSEQGLVAIQRFMGLIVALIAVQKITHGLSGLIGS